jgi:3-methylcrotonyl-CoA carboxylase alpha subunit
VNLQIAIDGAGPWDVALTRNERDARIWIDGREHRARLEPAGAGYEVTLDERSERMWLVVDHYTVHIHAFGRAWRAEVIDPVERSLLAADQADVLTAPMPGTVIKIAVQAGDAVTSGQPLVLIESMKMQNEFVAWRDGVVDRIHIAVGETFDRGAGLVGLVPEEVA